MKPTTKVRQHDITDCGAACLASVAAHYDLKLPIARIRQYASTNQKGTNILGLVEAAQRLGFQAKGVKGSLESLSKIPKPTIAHVNIAKSGGQRQRVAIARALYQNPEILILDEATSALDSISERYVQQALAHFQQNQKTIIVIAHRLNTIKQADKIIVLSEGKLAKEGTHAGLLAQKSVYYGLWQQQFEAVSLEV